MRESGVALDAIAVSIPFCLPPSPSPTLLSNRSGGTIEGIEHDPHNTRFTPIFPLSNIFLLAVGFGRIVSRSVP